MQLSKQLHPDLDFVWKSKLRDYSHLGEGKQFNQLLVKKLQKDKQKLLRQNIALRKQNRELVFQRQKYLKSQNDKSSLCLSRKSNENSVNYEKKQTFYRAQFRCESHNKTYDTFRSARDYSSVSKRTSSVVLMDQSNLMCSNSVRKPKKRFTYLGPHEIQNYINTPVKNRKEQETTFSSNFENISLKEQETKDRVSFVQSKSKQNLNLSQSQFLKQKNNKQNQLTHEILELKQVQSKLLDRIQERDQIIEKLQLLLAHSKSKQNKSSKDNDRETIDSSFSPKVYP